MSVSDEDRELFEDKNIGAVLNFLSDHRQPREGENIITELNLGYLGMTGNIPEHIHALFESALVQLELNNNHLEGPIPWQIGNFTNLRNLNLSENRLLTGRIPTELGRLAQLENLDLSVNQLTGPIPVELGQLAQLENLDLANNRLAGHIPRQLGNLTNLWGLNLSQNQLTGSIPPELGRLINLRGLNLSQNQLTGLIPWQLRELSELVALTLHANGLTGRILPGFKRLINLNELDLGNNQLTGIFPFYKGDFPAIEPNKQTFWNNRIVLTRNNLEPREHNKVWRREDIDARGKMPERESAPAPHPKSAAKGGDESEFGKIIKPYKKHLSRVDDKGAYFNTRFGVQKLRDDERGLYLKNGKGARLYLYKW